MRTHDIRALYNYNSWANARILDTEKDRIVAAQGMADAANAIGIDFR